MAKLFLIGNSITTGAWDEKGGWANRLISQTMRMNMDNEDLYYIPYNLGVSGDTVEDVIARLEQEVMARSYAFNPDEKVEFVFSIGVNDSVYLIDEGKPRFSNQKFEENLEKIIEISKKIAQRISFVGICPVDDDLLNPIPWAPDKAYSCQYVAKFENIINAVCSKHNIPFLPLFERWMSMSDWKDYLIDGVHPNSKGHELLANQIGDFIFTDQFTTFHKDK